MTVPPRAFVIGHPIAHSRSPLIHGHWLADLGLSGSYEKIDIDSSGLPGFLAALSANAFVGGNVTVPHKVAVMALADDVDAAGRAIGAVNTLWREGGRLMAGNTDARGFVANLDAEAPNWDRAPGRAGVLGAGGAARAVVYALLGRGFAVDVFNRTPGRVEALAHDFGPHVTPRSWTDLQAALADTDLLVNTTSLGMTGQPPLELDLAGLKPAAVVNDIVYVPIETPLLRLARLKGYRAVDGLGMLLHQAVPGFARWFGVTPEVTPALRLLVEDDLRAEHA